MTQLPLFCLQPSSPNLDLLSSTYSNSFNIKKRFSKEVTSVNSSFLIDKSDLKIYSDKDLAQLNPLKIPEHIAIIMDGNRRWAKNQGLPLMAGHWHGAERLTQNIKAAIELGVKVLTVYGFSTENWKRSNLEIKALMRLFKTYLIRNRKQMVEEGVCLNAIGDLTKFPKDVIKAMEETVSATKEGKKIDLVIALNYGGRDELKRALKMMIEDCIAKKIAKEDLSEDLISSYLDTAKWKDPDLLIRTSGESRISNFLLWQISYSEVIVTDTLWPDFREKDFLAAVLEYQKRELRLGK